MKGILIPLTILIAWSATAAWGHEVTGGQISAIGAGQTALHQHGDGVVTVQVHGVRSARGKLYVALYNDTQQSPFDHHAAVTKVLVPAAAGDMHVRLPIPSSGRFGVIVVHDEDSSGGLTRNWLGLPKEGYVGGHNEQSLNRPTFAQDSLELTAGTMVDLNLWYP